VPIVYKLAYLIHCFFLLSHTSFTTVRRLFDFFVLGANCISFLYCFFLLSHTSHTSFTTVRRLFEFFVLGANCISLYWLLNFFFGAPYMMMYNEQLLTHSQLHFFLSYLLLYISTPEFFFSPSTHIKTTTTTTTTNNYYTQQQQQQQQQQLSSSLSQDITIYYIPAKGAPQAYTIHLHQIFFLLLLKKLYALF
jgi:hypothetical protein